MNFKLVSAKGKVGSHSLSVMQEVAETQEKAGLKEECIEFYDKVCLSRIAGIHAELTCSQSDSCFVQTTHTVVAYCHCLLRLLAASHTAVAYCS